MWFHDQGYEDHLTTKSDSIPATKHDKWKQTDASLCTVLWFSITTNIQAQYQTFTTCYEVWGKAKKVFSNDVHNLCSVITKLNSLKFENMDMQAYLSKFDALKANSTTLMPFTKDTTTYAKQQSKYFMIVELSGLPSELDSLRNKILSGSNISNYEAISGQLLRLATPHAFGPFSTPSPIESSYLASHYHGRGGRTGEQGEHRHGIRCNYCNRYDYIEVDFRTKAREQQQRQPRVVVVAQPDIIKDVTIPVVDYNDFLHFKAVHQPSSVAAVTQSGNYVTVVSTSSLGP